MPLNESLLDEYLAKCAAFEKRDFPPTKEEKADLDKLYLRIVDSDRCAKTGALDLNNDSLGRAA